MKVCSAPIDWRTEMSSNDEHFMRSTQTHSEPRDHHPRSAGPPSLTLNSPDSPDGTLRLRKELWKLLPQGTKGYRKLLVKLSPEISADEANEAEKATHKNLRLLGLAIALSVCVQLLIYLVPKVSFNFQGLLFDVFIAGSLLTSLVLVSAFRIPFAGRLILPLAAVFAFLYRPPFMPWESISYARFVMLLLSLSFVAGRILDCGASTTPDRSHPRPRRWILLTLGLALLVLISSILKEMVGYILPLSLGVSLAYCFWGWFPGKWLERRANPQKVDIETLRLAALMRWGLFARGRTLAILLGLLPFWLFLNGLDLEKRLRWPEDHDAVRTQHENKEKVWFWIHKGAYLRKDDLRREEFYLLDARKAKSDTLKRIQFLERALRAGHQSQLYPELESQYNELRELLAPYRVDTYEELSPALEDYENNQSNHISLYLLSKNKIDAQGPLLTTPAIFSVENQLGDETKRLIPASREDIESERAHNAIWQCSLLGFGLIGFTFIWRRGGDSALARWLGIWLIGVGIAGKYRYVQFFLPALGFDLWHRSLAYPSAHLWLSLILIFNLLTKASLYLFELCIPCAALWVHRCWPAARRSERKHPWLASLAFAARIFIIAFCMDVCFFGTLLGSRGGSLEPASPAIEAWSCLAAVIVFMVITCGTTYGLLWWGKRDLPISEVLTTFLLFAVQVVTLAAITTRKSVLGADLFKLAGLVLGFALLSALVVLIFRKDLLHVSAARDVSFAIVYLVLPLFVVWFEEQIREFVSHVTQGSIVPERGAQILWVVIAVALLPPFRQRLEEGIIYLSNPRLSRLRDSIERALETLVTMRGEECVQQIRAALRECGVEDFLLYQRTGDDRFEVIGWGSADASPSLNVSAPLRQFLKRQRDFVDLDRVAFEWRFFFVQFELKRLHRSVEWRYLLPICLGTSLRALLIIPESTAEEQRVIGTPMIGDIAALGLAAASLRVVAQPLQPPKTAATDQIE